MASGLPENSSASTQTVPASIASFSVLEITGSSFIARTAWSTARLSSLRSGGRLNTTANTAKAIQTQTGAPRP